MKKFWYLFMMAFLVVILAACGGEAIQLPSTPKDKGTTTSTKNQQKQKIQKKLKLVEQLKLVYLHH